MYNVRPCSTDVPIDTWSEMSHFEFGFDLHRPLNLHSVIEHTVFCYTYFPYINLLSEKLLIKVQKNIYLFLLHKYSCDALLCITDITT